jgi:2-oxoglutarate/2-oxoacid ferredoxin oxidoreductase subunit beta
MALALSLGSTFVARAFTGDIERTKEMIKAAIQHEGYALIDIFHPCVTFNKVNTFAWYKNHSYWVDESHDPSDFQAAMSKALNTDMFALGILYQKTGMQTFDQMHPVYQKDQTPVIHRKRDMKMVNELLK